MRLPSNAAMSNAMANRTARNHPAISYPGLPMFFGYGLQPNRQLHLANAMGAGWRTQPYHAGMTNGLINTHPPNPQQPTASNGIDRFHPYSRQHVNSMDASSLSLNNHARMSNGSAANGNHLISNGSHRFNPNSHQHASSMAGSWTTSSYHTASNNVTTSTQACSLGPAILARQNVPMRMPNPTSRASTPQTTVATSSVQQPQQPRMPTATITLAPTGHNNSSDQSVLPNNSAAKPVNGSQGQDKHQQPPSSVQNNPMPSTSGHHKQAAAARMQPTDEQMEEIFRVAYTKHISKLNKNSNQPSSPTLIPDNISIGEYAQLFGQISNDDLIAAEEEVFALSAKKKQ